MAKAGSEAPTNVAPMLPITKYFHSGAFSCRMRHIDTDLTASSSIGSSSGSGSSSSDSPSSLKRNDSFDSSLRFTMLLLFFSTSANSVCQTYHPTAPDQHSTGHLPSSDFSFFVFTSL